jgi:nitroreductase
MNIENDSNHEIINILFERKSVRNFTGENISKAQLDLIFKAAMSAPSAVNMQPWAFIVIEERIMLDKLADELPYAKMLNKAGAAIVVCAIPHKALENKSEFAILDCACSCENILIAAEALGLGAVWTAVYPWAEVEKNVRAILDIPDEVIPVSVIPIGHPTGEDVKKEKYNEANIHYKRW